MTYSEFVSGLEASYLQERKTLDRLVKDNNNPKSHSSRPQYKICEKQEILKLQTLISYQLMEIVDESNEDYTIQYNRNRIPNFESMLSKEKARDVPDPNTKSMYARSFAEAYAASSLPSHREY